MRIFSEGRRQKRRMGKVEHHESEVPHEHEALNQGGEGYVLIAITCQMLFHVHGFETYAFVLLIYFSLSLFLCLFSFIFRSAEEMKIFKNP